MYKNFLSLTLLILLISCGNQNDEIVYPDSKQIDFNETIHGYQIQDSYRWLEDFTSSESLSWVKQQNKFTKKFIGMIKYKYTSQSLLE